MSDFCVPSVFVNYSNFWIALMIISSSQTTKLGRWVLGFHTMILAGTLHLFHLCIILLFTLCTLLRCQESGCRLYHSHGKSVGAAPSCVLFLFLFIVLFPCNSYCMLKTSFAAEFHLNLLNFLNHIACNLCYVSKELILCQNK